MKINHGTFISFLILNFLQIDVYGQIIKNNLTNYPKQIEKNKPTYPKPKAISTQIEIEKFITLLASNIDNSSKENSKDLNNFEIKSNTQIRTDELFIAEGDVVIQNGSSILVGEKLEYNYKFKKISLNGNLKFYAKDQFFEASKFEFDLNKRTGFISDIFGSINFDSLELLKLEKDIDYEVNEKIFLDNKIKNVRLNSTSTLGFEELDLKEEGTFVKKVTSQKFILELNDPQEWRFKSDKIDIDNNEWYAEKLILTNDPFNKPQLVINNHGFRSTNKDGEITLKSNWSTIVLDNKIPIPTGPRRYKIEEDYLFRWGIGYEKNSKDGFFITRNFDPKYFGNKKNTRLSLKKEFYLQRALNGNTESFSNKNESVLAAKSKRDAKFLDYLGLEGDFKTKINNFNLNSNFSLNSFDLDKFKKSFSINSEISTILNSENQTNKKKETKLSLFGNYRDKVWNGSLGEKEIISAYGVKIIKKNKWGSDKISKSSTLAASYGDYQSSDRIDSLKVINRERLNIFLDRTHSYKIWAPEKNKFINEKNIYSPTEISSGLNINALAKVDLYRYSDDNYQDLFIFKVGPELTIGNFKNKLLDYTKLSIYQKITLADGISPFGFDQSTDNNIIEFNLKQQLFGPLTIDYKTEYNLDSETENYNKFFNTKYELTWNRRAYSLGIFYNDESKAGGLNFKINSFNFDGYGQKF